MTRAARGYAPEQAAAEAAGRRVGGGQVRCPQLSCLAIGVKVAVYQVERLKLLK